MNSLKKFNQNSDSSFVDFAADGIVMILSNDRNTTRTVSVLISNGMTAATHRIANNVPEEKDIEELVQEWLAANAVGGDLNQVKGEVYANHNIVGLGREVILDNGVQLQKDSEGNPKLVFRFARWFADGSRESFNESFEKANATLRRNLQDAKDDLELFKGDAVEYPKAVKEYRRIRAQINENNEKISVLENPYIPGMSTAYISNDVEEIKTACKNSGRSFEKLWPNGYGMGADQSAIGEESDANVNEGEEKPAETTQGAKSGTTKKVTDPIAQAATEAAVTE